LKKIETTRKNARLFSGLTGFAPDKEKPKFAVDSEKKKTENVTNTDAESPQPTEN
jgi:hypothetical protein